MEVCKFCGQTILGDGCECECFGAKQERKRNEQYVKAVSAIRTLFVLGYDGQDKVEEEAVDVLMSAAHEVIFGGFTSASFTFAGGVKAKISIAGDGTAKVCRTDTTKRTADIES